MQLVFGRQPSVSVSVARVIPTGACINRIEANAFATNWVRAWNKKDVDAVLEHYVEDAKFISPKAATFVGDPVIEGKKALSEYWHLAAKKIEKIEFKLDHIVWDSDSNELIIFYEANLNGVCSRACEAMKFDSSGRQISGGSDVWGINLVAPPEHPHVRFGS